jgi:ABC-type uncharacterized transport system substrate-binding protein
MDRRAFLAGAAALLAASLAAEAQQAGKVGRIGYLSTGTAEANGPLRQAFIDGLRNHGWINERNVLIEYRWERTGKLTLDALATELVRQPLDVIVAVNTPSALAVKRVGATLPVLFATVSEPVAIGLVDSLPRPGTNFTGLTTINRELMSKRLEILKETIPGLTRVGYLANPDYGVHKAQLAEMNDASRGLGLTLHLAEVRTPSEFEQACGRLAAARVGALIVQQDDLFIRNRALVIETANRRRLPAMYVLSLHPRSGGFMSYGANAEALYRRAAEYVDKVLRGAKPSDLPVERPTTFELVINLKTAKALGLTIPPSLLARADQVIE